MCNDCSKYDDKVYKEAKEKIDFISYISEDLRHEYLDLFLSRDYPTGSPTQIIRRIMFLREKLMDLQKFVDSSEFRNRIQERKNEMCRIK